MKRLTDSSAENGADTTAFADSSAFYRERVPAQFNRLLEEQTRCATSDREAARVLEEMRAVRTAIRVEVRGNAETETHWLTIENGVMATATESKRRPFLLLSHAGDAFESLRAECGESVLGFLGALAGLQGEMRLTSERVRSLRALAGSLDFEVLGPEGFALRATFGLDQEEDNARSTIRLDPDVFARLRSGDLEAQDGFLSEEIVVEGDLEMAIGVALAVLAPD